MGILFVPRGGAGRTPIPADQPPPCDWPFPSSGCWTTVAGPVADSTVRAPRG